MSVCVCVREREREREREDTLWNSFAEHLAIFPIKIKTIFIFITRIIFYILFQETLWNSLAEHLANVGHVVISHPTRK